MQKKKIKRKKKKMFFVSQRVGSENVAINCL